MQFTGKQKRLIAGALLFLVSFLVYIPALRAGFVWDDDTFLWDNPLIHAPGGLHDFWFTTKAPDYFPLTSSMLWLEWRIFGAQHVWGYHGINVLLHACGSILLWRLLRVLNIPGAWFAALIFAIHPVNVEAVAWITQRKSTLSMVLALLSALLFFRSRNDADADATRTPFRFPHYWLALCCFLLALLSKTSVVMLPAALLIVIWWRCGALTRRDFLATLPFFAIAGALSLVTIWFQYQVSIGTEIVREDGALSRLAIAGRAVWFYLSKAVAPRDLVFIYPRWQTGAPGPAAFLPLVCLAALVAGLGFLRARPWARATLAALGIYVALLFPVLGFFNIYFMRYSLVADHYQYAALPALLALVTAFAVYAARRLNTQGILRGIAAAIALVLAFLSWRQAGEYRDTETLLRATITKNPGAWVAHNNLGNILSDRGRTDEAIALFRQCLAINPAYAEAHSNLGKALQENRQLGEAIVHLRKAVELKPDSVIVRNNLGSGLQDAGQLDEAMAHFQSALAIDPDSWMTHHNIGLVLSKLGRLDEAIASFRKSIAFNPVQAKAHTNLASVLRETGQLDEALLHYRRAVEIEPRSAVAHYNLGNALVKRSQDDEAIASFQRAVEINPEFVLAHNNLGNALRRQGRLPEAIAFYQRALAIQPDFALARKNLDAARALLPPTTPPSGGDRR